MILPELAFPLLITAMLTVFIGALLQGSIGFGLALVAAPFLLLIDPVFVPGPLLIAALCMTILMSFREWKSIDAAAVKWALPGRIAGTVAGVVFLSLLPKDSMLVAFGILILIAVFMSIIGITFRPGKPALLIAGTISGFMGTTSAIGGPPMALLYQNAPGSQMRATLSVLFAIGSLISIIALAVTGHLGTRHAMASLVLIPGVVAGFYLSPVLTKRIDKGAIRPVVLTVAGAAAVIVIVKGLF
jgi:uncharacterized protein